MNIVKRVETILKDGGIEEYLAEAKLIVLEVSNLKLEDIILGKIANEDKIIEIAKSRAQTKKPLQYLLNCAYFMGSKYKVNENVLIPRDETEILVNCAYELVKNRKEKIDILDIGTGSGCISIELAKKMDNVEILGVDISSDAIRTALENVNNQNVVRKVILRKSDLYSKIRGNEKFDLIVSNPPYIPLKNKNELQIEVLKEPESALFANDENGVEFYDRIIKDAPKYLKEGGYVAFELGQGQAGIVQKMLQENFCDIKITVDLANIKRVITAKLKEV